MRSRIRPKNRSGKNMRIRQHQRFMMVMLVVVGLVFFWSCDDPKKDAKTQGASKKIAVKNVPPAPPKPSAGKPEVPAPPEKKTVPAPVVSDEPETIAQKRIYDPVARLDPFIPLFKAEAPTPSVRPETTATGMRQKRIPQTPLEKIGIGQLKLVAVVRSASGDRALVEDSAGKGYIIRKGTYIGLNSGIVTQISKDSISIEEESENLMGELITQNIEMKLQKPAGE